MKVMRAERNETMVGDEAQELLPVEPQIGLGADELPVGRALRPACTREEEFQLRRARRLCVGRVACGEMSAGVHHAKGDTWILLSVAYDT